MGSAPVIHWLRPGVGFTPRAAESFARVEAALGRRVQTNSTYRDYDKQMGMYRAWNAWVNGTGPRPHHSRAIHPDFSIHCRGEAVDTDEWTSASFRALMADYGWVRTAAWDPTEQHHFEYQVARDNHRGEASLFNPIESEEDDMNAEESRALFDIRNMMQQQKERAAGTYPSIPTIAAGVAEIVRELPKLRQTHTRAGDAATRGTLILKALAESPALSADEAASIASLVVLQLSESSPLSGLSDEDVSKLAKAAADEADRRERERLA